MRNKQPEYIAILGGNNGGFSVGRRSRSIYNRERFNDYGRAETSARSDRGFVQWKDSGKITQTARKIPSGTRTFGGREESNGGLEKGGSVKLRQIYPEWKKSFDLVL